MNCDARTTEFNRLYQLGISSAESGRTDEADGYMASAAMFAPEKWCAIASKLVKDGEEEAALAHFRRVLTLTDNPQIRSGALNNIGLIYTNRGQLLNALEVFEQAHKLFPCSPDALANIGLVHKWRGRLDEAERWISRALQINPWHEAAQFTLALIALLRGDYGRGFELYECRWRSKAGGLRKLETPWPEWDGANGRRVFVYGEQGAGDIFLMLRYARLIRERGLWQCWVVHKSMVSLVSRMTEIDCVIGDGDPLPEFDCHIPAASLPRLFKTTIDTIPSAPYIPRPEIGVYPGDGWNVGIVWRGSKSQLNDRFRSTCLDDWKPVLSVPNVRFHSLQVDGADEALLYDQVVLNDPPKNWFITAARLIGVDLVISVDTSLVHLAGAMGVPCWVPMHCRPYFVYPLTHEHCPWYPSVRLYKQRKEFEWTPVFERIANDLTRKQAGPFCGLQ